MSIITTTSLESNKHVKINFKGGDLSSDAVLLLIREFAAKTGLISLVKRIFKTDANIGRTHTDADNLLQMIFQIIAAYFEDDCADELTKDPVFLEILRKESLASQPTLSRFWNRMDESSLHQLDQICQTMRDTVYAIRHPEMMLFDLDSTLLNTYGHQEGEGFNFHYQAHGYHPLLCFDGLTDDLLKAELRDGTQYCSKGSGAFMTPLMQEYREKYPSMPLYLRGDSGFAAPELYETLWSHSRRVVFRIEKPYGQMVHMYTFVVTTMESLPEQVIRFYCGRGRMENFIKEAKSGFDFSAVSSRKKVVNANLLQVHVLAYNLFNWFRRLVLPDRMKKQQVDTIRLKLLKVAARVI